MLNYKLDWEVFMIFTRILMIWSILSRYSEQFMELNCDWSNKRSRYLVSLASLDAILIFDIKSFFDCPASASSTFAPILVEDLNNYLEIIYSFSFSNCL